MVKYKKAQQTKAKAVVTVQQLGDWLEAYASNFNIVDPKGQYKLEYTNIHPIGEPGYIQELRFKRVDRKVR